MRDRIQNMDPSRQPTERDLEVGQAVLVVPDDDDADDPLNATVTAVHDDGRVDLSYTDRATGVQVSLRDVPHFLSSDGDTDEPYFLRPGDVLD